MSPLLISILAFVCVAGLVVFASMMFRGDEDNNKVEGRLDLLTGLAQPNQGKDLAKSGLLSHPLDAVPGIFEEIVKRFQRLSLLFEQADTSLTPTKFFAISGGLGLAGIAVSSLAAIPWAAVPFMGLMLSGMPLMWLMWRRKRRLSAFAAQLPDAMELLSRALRAGHSLAAGFDLVKEEMAAPIGMEFGRVYEEQNHGIAMDEALQNLADRVPNLDLKFFATAVVLQRQTGGDLAEILDKIGYLVRERFKIWGQVQALTGEGRLSGIVLLALPPVLFLAVYRLNPEYMMTLFTDPMGKQMLAGAVVMQVLGALVIRKIINIKV